MKRYLFVVALIATSCGATARRSTARSEVSSGHTGCPPDQNKISEETDSSWKVTCAGKDYYCSADGSIQCKEAVTQGLPVKLE